MKKKKLRLSIDEAGDLGTTFTQEKSSSRFFIMTGVIDDDLKNTSAGDVVNQIANEVFGSTSTKKIHFAKASQLQKQHMVNLVSKQNVKAITVVTDKVHVINNNIFKGKYDYLKHYPKTAFEIYFGTIEKLLIEVSKYAEVNNIELVVDIAECAGMISQKMAKDLIAKLIKDKKIANCFKNISVVTAANRCSLQVADIITSSIYSSIEPSQLFNPLYAIAFAPVILKSSENTILDFGLCFSHSYNQDKVYQFYPWFRKLDSLYTDLFPIRSNEPQIV